MKWLFGPSALLQQGPHIEMLISATRPEVVEGRVVGLEFPEISVRALIDTGASLTIINPEIAQTCKLRQTDRNKINAVGGVAGEFPAYAASISFPGTELPSFDVIRVVACPIVKQRFFSCLIGRDILQKWLLNYDGKTGELEVRA